MPLDASSLNTEISGSTSNSYVTLQEFVDYADLRLNINPFREATADDRIRALIMAAARLNSENWSSARSLVSQALAWPRIDVPRIDTQSYLVTDNTSIYYAYNEIPREIKEAQYELALAYLSGFETENERDVDSFQTDGVIVRFAPRSAKKDLLPQSVARLIAPFTRGNRLIRA